MVSPTNASSVERNKHSHTYLACPVALKYRRYNDRHDQVLATIAKFVREHLEDGFCVLADLDSPQDYLFPPTIAITDLRPDLVAYRISLKIVIIVELTVCFEASYEAAHRRKVEKYIDLVDEARGNGYTTKLVTLEVGSRGFINTSSFDDIRRYLVASRQEWRSFLQEVSKLAITGSYRIWTSRNHIPP